MESKSKTTSGQQEPQPGDFALVQLSDFRCMGVFRRDGKWHAAYSNHEALNVVEVVEMLSTT